MEKKVKIDITIPKGWHELDDKQLTYIYSLMAEEMDITEVKVSCFFKWGQVEFIGMQPNGLYLFKKGPILFEYSSEKMNELLSHLDWVEDLPAMPLRISKIKRRQALSADFAEVPFEKFIMVDNMYQGYMATRDESLLDQMSVILYNGEFKLKPAHRVNIFFWVLSLKNFFANRYKYFFQPASDTQGDNLLGSNSVSVEDAMNAQIRALTKGDVTKEKEILSLDTWRALTELNAQAKEYKDLNAKTKKK